MPYRRPSGSRSSITQGAFQRRPSAIRDYAPLQTGTWRHQFTTNSASLGSAPLTINEYLVFEHVKFVRTFSGSADDPPTPDQSNNYANIKCFNGSSMSRMNSSITLKNNGADPITLDVYEIALSFWEGLIWDTIKTATCPIEFNVSSPNQGNVSAKTITASIIDANDILAFKFSAHYCKPVGTVTIGNTNGDNVATFPINSIPPKCRRSQTGMYYAHIFHYPAVKNLNQTSADIEVNHSVDFDEHPSENRLPYIN